MEEKKLEKLQKNIAVNFKNKTLLRQAMTHRSYINEHLDSKIGHNERLEFLGDAVLEIVVTEYLFLNYKDVPEGDLTNWRASLVNAKMLHEVAESLKIEDFLYLSKGEAKDKNKKSRQFILANAIEAIIGAIYLDQGMTAAKKFILNNIISELDEILANQLYLDPKSRFQEKAQELKSVTPNYKILEESGPDHAKIFIVGLYLENELVSKGQGSSKQEAQVDAARKGLKKLDW